MPNPTDETTNRRQLKTRSARWVRPVATFLKNLGLTPNAISIASIFFATASGVSFYASRLFIDRCEFWLVAAAIFIQLRLLCNLMDGLIAIELGLKSKSGEIYNDAPDRLADILILIGAGYSLRAVSWGADLGWIAASLALLTAYVRVLGSATGASTYFIGPMAKQHRMAVMTLAALGTALERNLLGTDFTLMIGLTVVAVGAAFTCARRLHKIIRELESR